MVKATSPRFLNVYIVKAITMYGMTGKGGILRFAQDDKPLKDPYLHSG